MSGILDGQPVDATNSNPAWLAANGDDEAQGKIDFNDQAPGASTVSGAAVTNIQKNVNSISSFTGWILNSVYNALPSWATTNRGASGNNLKQRIEAIDTAFHPSTGHKHTGAAGDAPQVSASTLTDLNYYRAEQQVVQVPSLSGSSMVVTTQFSAKTSGGGSGVAGVITDAPYNRCEIRDSSNGDQLEDASGNKVYGRLTYAATVWTLSLYVFDSGAETSYNLVTPTNVNLYYREVFTLATLPTIGADLGALGSLDATADVVDASPTQRGLVNTLAQSFAGLKVFNDLLGLLDTITTSFYLRLSSASSTALTAARTLTFDVKNGDRTISLSADLTVPATASVQGTNTGDVSLTAVGSSPSSQGASLSGQALTLQPADGTNPGLITAGTQTIGGNKTFSGTIAASNFSGSSSGTNTGDVSLGAVGSSPNANGASLSGQALTLQPADASNPGVMTATTQSIGGDKTWAGLMRHSGKTAFTRADDSTTTGSNATLTAPTVTFVKVTNASLASIQNIGAGVEGQIFILLNARGGAVNIVNGTGNILTGTGLDISMDNTSSLWFVYDSAASVWRVVGGSGSGTGGGSFTNGTFTGTSITVNTDGFRKYTYTGGSAQTFTSLGGTPTDGQVIRIFGSSDTNTLTIPQSVVGGLNGDIVLYQYSMVELQYDATLGFFQETFRRV